MSVGTVYLVGAGPGDPGLLTIRGLEVLRAAEVVVYDRLVDPRILAEAPPSALCVFARKRRGDHALSQPMIHTLLIRHARLGRRVVRLKGGDPFVFGRGAEEAEALAVAGVPFEVAPGVSAAVAVPAYAGIPLARRGWASSFAVVTGHEAEDGPGVDWNRLATAVDTLVVLMGAGTLPRVVGALLRSGRPPATPVALIRWGTTARQETVTGTLADIVRKAEGLEPPAVAIFGDVVGLRSRIAWFEPRSLAPGDAGPPVSAATLGVRRAGDLTRRSPRSHGGKGDASHPFDSGRASRTHSSIQEEAK